MWRATWKSLWARKLRLLLSTLAVVLGVAFVAGSFIFTTMLQGSFDSIVKGTVADVEVQPRDNAVNSASGSGDGTATKTSTPTLDPGLIQKIRRLDGVLDVQGSVSATGVHAIGSDGRVIASFGPPQLGFSWYTLPAFGGRPGVVLKSGHSPTSDSEVVVDPQTLEKSGYRIGDRIRIITPDQGTVRATVVGTATWGSGGTAGASYLFFSRHRAQQLFVDGADAFTGIGIRTSPGADRDDVARRVNRIVPGNFKATNGQTIADETTSQINDALKYVNTFLLIFAGISLVVAAFLIVNTFSILVAQRSRELALYRAIGASRRQIRGTVLVEALIVGLAGSALGVVAGIGVAYLIKYFMAVAGYDMGVSRLTVPLRAVVVPVVVGVAVTLIAALMPAQRATEVPPVEAMTGAAVEKSQGLGDRAAAGVTMALFGLLGLVIGLWGHPGHNAVWAGVGMGLVTIGVAIASPLLGRPVVWLVGRAYRIGFGEVGRLAELNSVRQPRRTAATASALMIGLTLVSLMTVFGASAKVSVTDSVHQSLRGDFVIGSQSGSFPRSVAESVSRVHGVSKVHAMSTTALVKVPADGSIPDIRHGAGDADAYLIVGAMKPGDIDRIYPQRITSGRAFRAADELIVASSTATAKHLKVGSTVLGYSPSRQKLISFTVVGLYDSGDAQSVADYWTSTATLSPVGLDKRLSFVSVDASPGADPAQVKKGLERATTDTPLVSVMDVDEYAAQQTEQVDQILVFIYALLGLSIVIAVLGIVNTLGLSIIERTREIGLLRAIALKRREIRLMITLESVVISLLGATVGLILGVGFGAALQHLMADQGITVLSVPWRRLLVFLAAAAIVGVLAAVWPARRATRIDILKAVSSE
ncbi:ABC transporter permease [Acidipropionibacterium virtanenii]|uniref:ABC transporter permease YtrF n=1 Tax=Acidipropionibacterium virtanenii TaxID=2057246 RepID=A0A344UPK4_9ACTN|nr:ABC transporter permease [Acidipropionibacterium virtanenii]AXE37202.1 ABC transporter permease YtrF [Acidipropionibacterium virtanenii]